MVDEENKHEETSSQQQGDYEEYVVKLIKDRGELDDNEIKTLLAELEDTRYWTAIVSYILGRVNIVYATLRSQDPFKEPTSTARTQGFYSGVFDLVDAVVRCRESLIKEEEKVDEEAKNKDNK